MSQIYKSATGKVIDMGRLISQNELEVAVSNVKINARGDELGPGGQIIRKKTDIHEVAGTGIPAERKTPAFVPPVENNTVVTPQELPQEVAQPTPVITSGSEKPQSKGKS